ncbi:MAG: hypothetical protein Q4F72_12395 [Desulfovibrionaceae bacterium]|nr:hypothetical protein [Desulfovibrionaceae bacterium]
MRRFKSYLGSSLLAVLAILVLTANAWAQTTLLQGSKWDPYVKRTINDMMTMVGADSAGHDASIRPYAVFDFDNTVSILDVEEQLAIYQLEHMRFAVAPDKMYDVLTSGIPDVNMKLGEDYGNLTVAQVASDAAAAYKKLCAKGFVDPDGSKAGMMAKWQATDDWKEFATKARWMYDAIGDSMDVSVSYPWITYWFTGMTSKQVYELALEAFTMYAKASMDPAYWCKKKWTSPASYEGAKAGQLSVSYKQGITVSPELRELFKALDENGIDAWICSASYIDVITAAVKAFELPGVDGILAMTNKKDGLVYTNAYDYDFHAQTQGIGKAESIDKLIRPLYRGAGPVLVAFDSQGDFNFCSEYKDTLVGLCLNRARKDDAGLLAAIALYQNKHNVSLEAAIKAGDTRYVLQGRNENGGVLWARPEIQALGKDKTELLSGKAEGWLKMLEDGTKPADLVNKCTELTGKLKKYDGYKVR